MEVNVVELSQSEDKGIHIRFSSKYGIASGCWKGNPPEINQSYYVEFDIPQKLIWGKDIIEVDFKEYKVWTEHNNIFLNVQLECWEEDDCTTVRLGDSLILLETEGMPCSVGSYIRIQSKEILLFPFNL